MPSCRHHFAPAALTLAAVVSGTLAQQPPGKQPAFPPVNPAQARLDQTFAGLGGPGLALTGGGPAGRIAAGCEDGTIQLWHQDVLLGIRNGSNTSNVFPGHQGPVISLAWNGGPVLASAGVDHKIQLLSVVDGQILRSLPAGQIVRTLAMSPDGRILAGAGDDRTIHFWQVDTGKSSADMPGHTDWVLCLAFSPDGKQLASAGYDGIIRLWDNQTAKKLREFQAGPPPAPKTIPEPVIVWSLAFSPDGKELAAGTADGGIHLHNPADGKLVRSLAGHGSAVTGLQFHPGGTILASASKDRTVRLWNPVNAQPFKVLEGHEAWVQGVTFLSQGTRLASVGADQTVRIWDLNPPLK
jgi:WD40 repeat protein